MDNFIKDNLLVIDKDKVPTGTPVLKLGDIYLPLFYEEKKFLYLCSYVNRNYFSYNTIIVSGMPTDAFVGATYTDQETWESADVPTDIAARDPNGTYTLTNPDAQYTSQYVWQSENGCVIAYNDMNMCFAIEPGAEYKGTNKITMSSGDGSASYPVPEEYDTSNNWLDSSWSTIEGGSVVVPEPAAVEQYWEGYKLAQNEDGKWDFATEKTKLTYGDYMPVAGRFYDADCSMEITNVNLSEDAPWSCPRNMTSNENDEWVITTDSSYSNSANDNGYMAFDGNLSTQWITNNPSGDDKDGWICWQNKKRKVCVKYIEMYKHESSGDYFINPQLEGSDDGVNWQIIGKWEAWDMGNGMTQKDFSGNAQFFYYHRIIDVYGGGARAGAGLIKAYSQIPREVPK